jgi:hypothetical protein
MRRRSLGRRRGGRLLLHELSLINCSLVWFGGSSDFLFVSLVALRGLLWFGPAFASLRQGFFCVFIRWLFACRV